MSPLDNKAAVNGESVGGYIAAVADLYDFLARLVNFLDSGRSIDWFSH